MFLLRGLVLKRLKLLAKLSWRAFCISYPLMAMNKKQYREASADI